MKVLCLSKLPVKEYLSHHIFFKTKLLIFLNNLKTLWIYKRVFWSYLKLLHIYFSQKFIWILKDISQRPLHIGNIFSSENKHCEIKVARYYKLHFSFSKYQMALVERNLEKMGFNTDTKYSV